MLQSLGFVEKELKILLQDSNSKFFLKFPHLVRVGLLIFVEIPGDGHTMSQSCKCSYQALNSLSGRHMSSSKIWITDFVAKEFLTIFTHCCIVYCLFRHILVSQKSYTSPENNGSVSFETFFEKNQNMSFLKDHPVYRYKYYHHQCVTEGAKGTYYHQCVREGGKGNSNDK